jgi:hypothetical protein
VPDALVPTLVNRVVLEGSRSREMRTLGVRALAGVRSAVALSALLECAVAGRTLFGKPRISTSPEGVAALRVLASTWGDHEEVAPVLREARGSRDPGVRDAVGESP